MKVIEAHKFFVKESRGYIGINRYTKTTTFWYWEWWLCKWESGNCDYKNYTIRQLLYYPIAYIKFMYYTFRG